MLSASGNIARAGGGILTITQDNEIVLSLNVIGTCFPARESNQFNAFLYIGSGTTANKAYIDYNDGTGEHMYDFKKPSTNSNLWFTNRGNQSTPGTVSGTSIYDVPLHFYQDLPDGIRDTVVNDYQQERTVTIRFERPQNITSIQINRMLLFGAFPSAISRLRNLNTLLVGYTYNVDFFNADFYSTQIRVLSISYFGESLDDGFPNWMLNSPLEELALSDSINLLGSAQSKSFDKINLLAPTLRELVLNQVIIDYKLPAEFGDLSNLDLFAVQNSSSPALRFPDDLSGLLALKEINIRGTRMPFAEIERLIAELPSNNIYLNIMDCNYSTDYDISAVNTSITRIDIGYQRWNANTVPSFINKLTGLKNLNAVGYYNMPVSREIQNYGNFSNCILLEEISFIRTAGMTTDIPVWFENLVNLKIVRLAACFATVVRADAFTNNFYSFITTRADITGAVGKFRNMLVDIVGTSTDANFSARPSGTYQAPAGYVQGVSNGAPASPMEKIYCLINNYAHSWLVKPL